MKMGSDSQQVGIEHSDFVNPTYRWRCATARQRGESVQQDPRARIELCLARLAELRIESARTAAELASRGGLTRLSPRDLSPESLRLLRKLGALKIEGAEIDRELASLHAEHRLDNSHDQPPTRPLP